MNTPRFHTVGIVGTGAMGRGIAQIAAQAGSTVLLFDTQADAIAKARDALGAQWDKLVDKGRLDATDAAAHKQRLRPAARLAELAGCDLVVEAIVEKLDVKQGLFAELEGVVGPDAVLATNTSSLSVTAIAAGLKRPERFAGYHFFNPVPLMKVVEVI
ncbi:MAG TPA: 3-hydroxyacyl-CoA dehydrogenase NAD-binding domain-containing protein, partial [Ottowia sp.]|nr:3-hydroxyacyl-CoA dehydrogenase NAD-binding domain-containing protein [Ottowia sp.]